MRQQINAAFGWRGAKEQGKHGGVRRVLIEAPAEAQALLADRHSIGLCAADQAALCQAVMVEYRFVCICSVTGQQTIICP